MRGTLISFSGIDGAGKSTQITRLEVLLAAEGRCPVRIWSRGGYTAFLDGVKALLRRLAGRRLPVPGESRQRQVYMGRSRVRKLWLAVAILDLLSLYAVQVRVWQWLGRPVICDRYVWDTLIDFQLHFPQEDVRRWRLWRLLERTAPKPDVVLLLMVSLEESVRRCAQKVDPFPAAPEVQAQRYSLYQALATSTSDFTVIDATPDTDTVFAEIMVAVDARMAYKTAGVGCGN